MSKNTEKYPSVPQFVVDGKTEKYHTGAIRDVRSEKGRFDLLPPFAIERLAKQFELGANRYAPRNWEFGFPFSRVLDSAFRHLIQYMQGKNDEDHLVAAAWNLMALMEFEERIKLGLLQQELDDLPRYLSRQQPKRPRGHKVK